MLSMRLKYLTIIFLIFLLLAFMLFAGCKGEQIEIEVAKEIEEADKEVFEKQDEEKEDTC